MGPSRFNMKLSNDEDLIMDSVYQRSEIFNSHCSTFTTKVVKKKLDLDFGLVLVPKVGLLYYTGLGTGSLSPMS